MTTSMRAELIAVWIAALGFVLALPFRETARGQAAEQDRSRFLVDTWKGTFAHTVKGENAALEKIDYSITGTVRLSRAPSEDQGTGRVWTGTVEANLSYVMEQNNDVTKGSITAHGPVKGTARLEINFTTGSYDLLTTLGTLPFECDAMTLFYPPPEPAIPRFHHVHESGPGGPMSDWGASTDDKDPSTCFAAFFGGVEDPKADGDLPTSGRLLTQNDRDRSVEAFAKTIDTSIGNQETISWSLVPGEPEDVKLVIDVEKYESWRPRAGLDEHTPTAPLTVVARLEHRGRSANVKLKQVAFDLVDTSRLPGVCMNYPHLQKSLPAPDLQFDGTLKASPMVTPDGQHAETSNVSGDSATIVVVSSDWGGWSTLRVKATVTGGRTLIGHLQGREGLTDVLLPKRDPTSKIADVWKLERGVDDLADDDDGESKPAGDGDAGDGLTLYEEYRGFYNNKREHESGDPRRKDVFVLDEVGARLQPAVKFFEGITGLKVHVVGVDEADYIPLQKAPAINFQAAIHHRTDEHAIDVILADRKGTAETFGGPGLPRQIQWIEIPRTVAGKLTTTVTNGTLSYDAQGIAHELLHAVNVWHHGEGDTMVRWLPHGESIIEQEVVTFDEKTGAPQWGSPTPIHVLREDGTVLTASTLGYKLPTVWNLGVAHGQHSGFENCVMRYDVADVYRSASDPTTRYLVYPQPEVVGQSLCASPMGTGVNDQKHRPQSRYGDADKLSRRGDCAHQVCVNDAMPDHPRRESKP